MGAGEDPRWDKRRIHGEILVQPVPGHDAAYARLLAEHGAAVLDADLLAKIGVHIVWCPEATIRDLAHLLVQGGHAAYAEPHVVTTHFGTGDY